MLELRPVRSASSAGSRRGGGRGVVVGFERLRVDFGTWTKVEFGVCEEIVWAGADNEGFADAGVRER